MLGKFTKRALLGGLVLLASTVLAATAFAEASVSGYIKFDAILDLQSPSGSTDFQQPPVAGSQADKVKGGLSMQVNESRFRFTSSSDTDMGKVSTNFEFDVWGTSNANGNPRVRHAYVTWGNWLFGQTWSTIMTDLFQINETLDFGGARGVYFVRQPMVRYTMPMGANKLVLAAETPAGNAGPGTALGAGGTPVAEDPTLPDIHAAYHMGVGGGKIAAAVVLAQYRFVADAAVADPAGGTAGDVTEFSTSAAGIAINGAFPVGGKNKFKFALDLGAPGRYVPFAAGSYFTTSADASDGKYSLNAVESATGIVLGYQHWLNDADRINFVYGSLTNSFTVDEDNPGDTSKTNPSAAGLGENTTSLHLNWIRSLTPAVKIGVEYGSWTVAYNKVSGKVDSEGKESLTGAQSRIQFSVQAVY